MNALKLTNVSKYYGGKIVLDDLSFSVSDGEFVSIIGSYGCGKTTLLKIIAGIKKEDSGEILVCGKTPKEAKVGRLIDFSFQKPTLLPWLNVYDNIVLPGKIQRIDNSKRAKYLLKLISLSTRSKAKISELSGGMQKMVAIIRSLTLKPRILLLDEPFQSIDEISRDKVHELILKIHKQNKQTTILVTHSLFEAVYLSDKVIVLSKNPARIKKIISIKLSSRDASKKYSAEILKYVAKLKKSLDV